MSTQAAKIRPCPLTYGQWAPLPEMTDEFDGATLDAAKWHATNPGWLGRQPGLFRAENVTVSGGQLHITMKHEDVLNAPKGYHTYTCGAVKSRALVRYGYFEVKARAMKSRLPVRRMPVWRLQARTIPVWQAGRTPGSFARQPAFSGASRRSCCIACNGIRRSA